MDEPSKPGSGLKPLIIVLGVLVVVGIGAAVGVYIVSGRIAKSLKERVSASPASGAVGRVVESLHTAAREEKRPDSFGCSLLSKEDASTISGTVVTRVESTSSGCGYFGVPDPSIQPEAIALKGLAGANADSKAGAMIDQFAGAMRSSAEQQDPGTRAGPGGERLLFAVGSSAALSASMELASNGRDPKAGGESVPGIGDDAFFVTMHRMFFVRAGTSYILIQPQFVKDPRGVAIAAARKILASPAFRS